MGNYSCRRQMGSKSLENSAQNSDNVAEIKAGLCNADPITKQGKRIQMAQMLCIPLIPIVLLIIQTIISLANSVDSKASYQTASSSVSSSISFYGMGNLVMSERQMACKYIASNYTLPLTPVVAAFNATDRLMYTTGSLPWTNDQIAGQNDSVPAFQCNMDSVTSAMQSGRNGVLQRTMGLLDCLNFYDEIMDCLDDGIAASLQTVNETDIWRQLLASRHLLLARHQYGVIYVIGWSYTILGNSLPFELNRLFIYSIALAGDYLSKSIYYNADLPEFFLGYSQKSDPQYIPDNVTNLDYLPSINSMTRVIIMTKSSSNSTALTSSTLGNSWVGNFTSLMQILSQTQSQLLDTLTYSVQHGSQLSDEGRAGAAVILVLVLVLAPVIFFLIHRMTLTIQNYALGLAAKTKELRREKKTVGHAPVSDAAQVGGTPVETVQEGCCRIVQLGDHLFQRYCRLHGHLGQKHAYAGELICTYLH